MKPSKNLPPRAALIVEEDYTPMRKLAGGQLFECQNGQQFVMIGRTKIRGRWRYLVRCTWSPQGYEKPGGITGAFFTHIGALLWLFGDQEVLKAKPVLALPAPVAAVEAQDCAAEGLSGGASKVDPEEIRELRVSGVRHMFEFLEMVRSWEESRKRPGGIRFRDQLPREVAA